MRLILYFGRDVGGATTNESRSSSFFPFQYRESFGTASARPAMAMTGISSPNENGTSLLLDAFVTIVDAWQLTILSHLFFIITDSSCTDVLMGRGGKNNQFVGNEKLRILARRRCREYQTATKKGKSHISRELVDAIRDSSPPGRYVELALCITAISRRNTESHESCSSSSIRFLKKSSDDTWEDVGDEIAREKTSQVLRDAINSVKTFSNMPSTNIDVTTPETSSSKKPSKQGAKAVTHEKSTPMKRPPFSEGFQIRPLSAASDSVQAPTHGWSNVHAKTPSIVHNSYSGSDPRPFMRHDAAFLQQPYHVTPSMTILPPSAARKRARFFESPLVPGYHRTPGFYSSDNNSAYGTPNVSYMYGSPPNPRKQNFMYTPPSISYRTAALPVNNDHVTGTASASAPYLSAGDSNKKDPSDTRFVMPTGQASAGQPSGESSDCWISDVPPFQSDQKPAARQQQQPRFGAEDFDPFNDELLSDSEHRDASPLFFA